MTLEEALQKVAEEGAIRIWRVSGAWQIAYRTKGGKYEARNMNKIGDGWVLGEKMVGSDTYMREDGWYPVKAMHHRAAPIELEVARENPGYHQGLTRQCATCKKFKPVAEFEREMEKEGGFRSWECNQCASERRAEKKKYSKEAPHVGDYVSRDTHAERPPAEGKI